MTSSRSTPGGCRLPALAAVTKSSFFLPPRSSEYVDFFATRRVTMPVLTGGSGSSSSAWAGRFTNRHSSMAVVIGAAPWRGQKRPLEAKLVRGRRSLYNKRRYGTVYGQPSFVPPSQEVRRSKDQGRK